MKTLLLLLFITISLFANEKDIEITAKINKDFSSKYIAMFQFEILNNTQDWQTIKNINVSFKKGNMNISTLNNEQMRIWSNYAKAKEKKLNASSKFWASFWFGAIGTIYSSSTILEKEDDLSKKVNSKNKYPKGHIYSGNIIIPPGLSAKRFLIVSSKNHKKYGYLNTLDFSYRITESLKNISLQFRGEQYISKEESSHNYFNKKEKNYYVWQSDL